jgi:hypothetical protein
MSKKRLYKKNIKTKKKIKGGVDGIDAAASAAAANSTKKLGDELGDVSKKLSNKVGDVDNAIDSLNTTSDNVVGAAGAVGATGLGAISNNPFAKIGKGALDKLKKGLQFIKGSLTPEDKYRHALLKLRKNPGFKNYFATSINKVIVLNFYNVLIELGKYSRNYSDISKEIFEITGENMFDEDDNLYSELNEETSGLEESSRSERSERSKEIDCIQDTNINTDKILSDENIKKFLNDTIILCIPVIKQNFKSLENIIEDYKKLKGKMNGLLEKAERENNVEKYFDDFRILSDEAIKQINAIFNDFDTSKMSGGEEIDNIEDDFYDALLKMSIGNRDNFSKLLKEKLHGILNKIIKQLYDIANCKHVIDDNDYHDDDYDMKFLEKTVETTDFNIEEFERRINERIGDLKKKQESLTEKQSDFDKKAEENYDNLKEKVKIFRIGDTTKKDDTISDTTKKDDTISDTTKKDDTISDTTKKDDTVTKKSGAKLFLPEALREEANAVSDSLSMVESQTEIQEENLEIVKFQKILIGIIQKMICKIQTNPEIDLDPFKTIVKHAFIEKKMQFRNLEKIWLKDFHEKRDLLIQLNEVLNKDSKEKKDLVTQESFEEVLETKEVLEYIKKIKTQIDIAVKNQKEIKEYIKTKEEKQKEEKQKEAKQKTERESVINGNKNNLDPFAIKKNRGGNVFAGGRPTRKFSSPVSRKTRRRRQTSL